MTQRYVVYSAKISLAADSAHEIHDVMCANAVANLGEPTVLVYPHQSPGMFACLRPLQIQEPENNFIQFYNVQEYLKTGVVPLPNKLKYWDQKLKIFSRLIYQYFLPVHVFPVTKLLHTRDWNCVKAAVRHQTPVVYERHYFQKQAYEPAIVNSPFLKVAITQSEPIRQSLVEAGMPSEKVNWLHNGFSPAFLNRQPEEAQQWRKQLLKENQRYLAIYSGALYRFKGVDLLIDVAKQLPDCQFAITGGTAEQVESYRQIAQEKGVKNIQFLGWILPRSRLVSLLQAADILLHPHRSGEAANFTNPVKFFQYMASGTPIVATKIPPLIPFQSAPLAAGWCQPDNEQELAQCIEAVLMQYPKKAAGYRSNIDYARQFTWEERAVKIMNHAGLDGDRPP